MRKSKFVSLAAAAALTVSATAMMPLQAVAATRFTRVMEYLDRGLVAIPKTYSDETKGMYLSWRLLGTEDLAGTTFDIYRDGKLIASDYDGTNYTDTGNSNGSDTGAVYYVVKHGEEITDSDVAANTVIVNGSKKTLTMTGGYENSSSSKPNSYGYFDIPLKVPADVSDSKAGSYSYTANDCSLGDVDNDGQYEIIVKWDPSNSKDNANTGYTGRVLFSCYELDGTMLWKNNIDLGYNIRAGAHYTQFIVYDLDGDGHSEIVMKTAPGSKDANGNYVTKAGNTSTIRNASNSADYRESGGYIISGPEYLTVFDGATGAALQTIDYTPAYSVASWGDTYGNRGNRFLAGVGYFGKKDSDGNFLPSVVMCRGYYTQAYVVAYDWDGSNLKQRFYHKGEAKGSSSLYGQGNHNLTVTDADNDGYDEIIYGSAVINNDGSILSNTQLGHGDAMHVNDFNNDGQIEVFQVHEEGVGTYGGDLWIPKTGKHIYGMNSTDDVGRGAMANIDDAYAKKNSNALAIGYTSSHSNAYDVKGNELKARPNASSRMMINSFVYWDGVLDREILDDAILGKYDASTGGTSRFYFGKNASMSISTNNSTKYNACITADLLGDWREEIVGRSGDSLRVYISTLNTDYKLTTLMHDSQYRNSVATENVGYNQPPHTSYYIGSASLVSGKNYLNPAYEYTKMTTPRGNGGGTIVKRFDFGNGSAEDGYTAVPSTTVYSSSTGYGFKDSSSQSSMTRPPQNVPSSLSDLHADQIQGETEFKVNLPNGTYEIDIYYGSWNTGFGTKYTIEGESSGNLYSTDATKYTTKVDVTDGVLNVGIAKGSKSYGGYINGMDIKLIAAAEYHFDFGTKNTQSGYTAVPASTVYSSSTGYGFKDSSSQSDMSRPPYNVASSLANLHDDQVQGATEFKVNVPNGTYNVTIYYGSWNTGFGTKYTVEGTGSGNLYSTDATTYATTVEVADGVLNVGIAKGSKSYGGYINGMDIVPATANYYFDFGIGTAQDGYVAVSGSDVYSSSKGYGFVDGSSANMSRAPYDIPESLSNLHRDQVWGEDEFKVNVVNGKYEITIYYGSWNTGFGVNYTVEGTSSGNLYSTSATTYKTTAQVNDGVLNIGIAKGSKSYGGYINGIDIVRK